jgi:hypothetical protein
LNTPKTVIWVIGCEFLAVTPIVLFSTSETVQ